MSGSKHGGLDSLSRRLRGDDNSESEEEDVEDAMDADLAALRGEAERDDDEQVEAAEEDEEVEGENEYKRATGDDGTENDALENDAPENDAPENNVPEDFHNVICYITTFERPDGLMYKKYLQFQHFATKFLLQDGILFRRAKPNMPPKQVVWNLEDRNSIISELHDESGQRGMQDTYAKVTLRYWWPHQYRDIENFVKTCDQCQRRRLNQVDKELHLMLYSMLW